MGSKKFENSIVKFLTHEVNLKELVFLSKWIEDDDNKRIFASYIKTNYDIRLAMSEPDLDSIKNELSKKIKKDKAVFSKRKIHSMFKYAALLVLIFSIGIFYLEKESTQATNEVLPKDILIPNEEPITITLDNGDLHTIDPTGNKVITDTKGNVLGHQNKAQLNYTGSVEAEKLVYNTLNVPRGKRFNLILSDGTQVILNSETSLKYPVGFFEGGSRDVFLTGEAYFNVNENTNSPFTVHMDEIKVEVLGTKFNASNYSENESIHTVLVEGSVKLYSGDNKDANTENPTMLKPGFKAEWDKKRKNVEIKNVDTRIYTAWIEGKLIFRNASFKQIRNTLERHYNVTINNTNKDLDVQLFDATFDIEDINDVLETLNTSYAIEYYIINNEVVIN